MASKSTNYGNYQRASYSIASALIWNWACARTFHFSLRVHGTYIAPSWPVLTSPQTISAPTTRPVPRQQFTSAICV